MKASNAASASAFVSAIQISCKARLAFGCWLTGSLFKTLAVLCTQQRCSRVFGHTSPAAFQKPSAPSAMTNSGAMASPRRLRSSSRSRQCAALSRAPSVKPTSSLLPSADQHQDALLRVLQARFQVDAVGPHIDVALGGEIAPGPGRVLVGPAVLEAADGRRREPRCILAKQGGERLGGPA